MTRITLGHGSGGGLTADLVRSVFLEAFDNPLLDELDDAARLPRPDGPLALTTDSFVVSPLMFPGGDIGSLAIHGTVNDLAVSGAVPQYLTLGAILEEGLPLATLQQVVRSAAVVARRAGVLVVTGDTKVVERGKGDGIYLNTAGVGTIRPAWADGPPLPVPGDAVLASGPIGDHGAVILGARAGMELSMDSDCAPVTPLIDALFDAEIVPRFLRDPTRGGLCGVMCDLAEGLDRTVSLREQDIPLHGAVETVCDITGVDPLMLACEGRVVAVVSEGDAERALGSWRAIEAGREAARIGTITTQPGARVVLTTRYGGERLLVRPSADPLPRIC